MEEHGEVSGKVQHTVMGATGPIDSLKQALHATEFLGYERPRPRPTVKGIIAGTPPHDHLCDKMEEIGHENPVRVVLDRTPFYGESGGQVGDTGKLVGDGFEFQVTDTQKDGQLVVHIGHLVQGVLREGAKVTGDRRRRPPRRHSPRPLRHAHPALRPAKESRLPCPAARLEGRRRLAAVRLHEPQPRRRREQLAAIAHDVNERVEAERAGEVGDPAAGRSPPARRDDAVRREVSRSGADGLDGRASAASSAAARISTTRGKSRCFEILSEEGVSAGTRRIMALTGSTRGRAHREDAWPRSTGRRSCLACRRLDVPDGVSQRCRPTARDLKKQLAGGTAAGEAARRRRPRSRPAGNATYDASKHALAEAARLLSVAPLAVPERIAAHAGRRRAA